MPWKKKVSERQTGADDAAGIGYYLRRQLLQLRTAGRNAIVLDRKTNPTQGKGDTNV